MTTDNTNALPPKPEPQPAFTYTNIRGRKDGTYVVTMSIPGVAGLTDYHVSPPKVDPLCPPGLWDSIVADVKGGAKVTPWKEAVMVLPEASPQEKLADAKKDADHVIKMLQMEYDVVTADEQARLDSVLTAWKRYRLDLEKNGLSAHAPEKPKWIT